MVPDPGQAAVLDHDGGPLLVLAGPGTGKTTTLVEAVARRVEGGLAPEQVLVLTFSRKAAQELRERIHARLGTASAGASAWTFHAFCYALVREHQPPELYTSPLRLLSGPEQDVALRDLLRGSLELGRSWPPTLQACLTTRGLAQEVRALLSRARELGLEPDELAELARREGRDGLGGAGRLLREYLDVLDAQGAHRLRRAGARGGAARRGPEHGPAAAERFGRSSSTSTRTPTRRRSGCCRRWPAAGRDLVVVGDPGPGIYAFRGRRCAGCWSSRTGSAGRRRAGAGGRPAHLPPVRRGAAGAVPRGSPRAARARAGPSAAGPPRPCSRRPGAPRGRRGAHPPRRSAPRPTRSPSCCAASTSSAAPRGGAWRCWSARVRGRCRCCAGC
jgi:hypothetical protein